MKNMYFHGEVVASQIAKLPDGLKKVNPINGRYIVADSESTGNHHCVEAVDGVEMYDLNGVLYLKNDVPVKMFCVDEKRHDTEVLEPGIHEFQRANEYDYLADMKRKVAD